MTKKELVKARANALRTEVTRAVRSGNEPAENIKDRILRSIQNPQDKSTKNVYRLSSNIKIYVVNFESENKYFISFNNTSKRIVFLNEEIVTEWLPNT